MQQRLGNDQHAQASFARAAQIDPQDRVALELASNPDAARTLVAVTEQQ